MTDSGWVVLVIPFVAGFIGWFTNWLAVKALMFPVEFVGIPPVFGWQGVMPKNAVEMSLSFSKLIREKLIDMDALFRNMKHSLYWPRTIRKKRRKWQSPKPNLRPYKIKESSEFKTEHEHTHM